MVNDLISISGRRIFPDPKIPKATEATMYFPYAGKKANGVKSNSTFEAIINGERTSTTRYSKDGHSDFWLRLKPKPG
jgi:hypothetical protein